MAERKALRVAAGVSFIKRSTGFTGARSGLWQEVATTDRWQLQDAKSQFSEVVQRALDGKPQCVTKHGRDAVVVIAYDTFADAVRPRQNLFDFFRSSPLVGVDLDLDRLPGDVREVDV